MDLVLPLKSTSIEEAEKFLMQWAKSSGLEGRVESRFIFATEAIIEALTELAGKLKISGEFSIGVEPFTGFVVVNITFPREIPLDPSFDHNDGLLDEYPEMRILPDIFWHDIILKWVDKATWTRHGKKVTISLTQYARDANRPGELYFLAIRPHLAQGLKVIEVSQDMIIASAPDQEIMVKLSLQSAFLLKMVDGKTPMRDIYRTFIGHFGMIHPLSFGNIVEDLIDRGLIISGDSLVKSPEESWAMQRIKRFLRFQYSISDPDALVNKINDRIGFLWGYAASVVYVIFAFAAFTLLFRDMDALKEAFANYTGRGIWSSLAVFICFFLAISGIAVVHELSHALVCKRLGGRIHEMGLLLYYGSPCAYVDTTDAWMFPSRWHRIMVSFAGPLSTLLFSAVCGLMFIQARDSGQSQISLVLGALFVLCFVGFIFNMNPFIETDGYYILMDFLEIPNLRRRAFKYAVSSARSLLAGGKVEQVPSKDRYIFLAYSISAPIFLIFVVFLPSLMITIAMISSAPSFIAWGLMILFMGIFFEVQLKAAMTWYKKTYMAPIDLKNIE